MKVRAIPVLAVAAVLTMTLPAHAEGEAIPAGAKYVALGSSFAAGPGILPTESDSPAGCARSTQNYANQIAASLSLNLVDATCSGATTANVLTTAQNGVAPQIDAVSSDTHLVTMTIGGNDVNYLGSIGTFSCQDGGGTNCGTVDEQAITTGLTTVGSRIADVIEAVHTRAPQAEVVVVNYQTILPTSGALCEGVPLSDTHAAFERNLRDQLDAATADAAAEHDATLVDVASASADHNACATDPWIEKYTVAAGKSSYHPMPSGMTNVASMVVDELQTTSGVLT
jgi:lysophospholipase L1-like esterase